MVWLEAGEYWLLYATGRAAEGQDFSPGLISWNSGGTGLWGWHEAPVTWVLERAGATVPRGVLNRVHGLCGLWLTRVHAIILVVGTEGARVEDDYRTSNVLGRAQCPGKITVESSLCASAQCGRRNRTVDDTLWTIPRIVRDGGVLCPSPHVGSAALLFFGAEYLIRLGWMDRE